MRPWHLLSWTYGGVALVSAIAFALYWFLRPMRCVEHAAFMADTANGEQVISCPSGHLDYLPGHSIVVCRCGGGK